MLIDTTTDMTNEPPTQDHTESLRAIKALVWDLDNTLYRLQETIRTAFDMAVARAVIALGVPIEFNEAVELARQSFLAHGFSGQAFIDQYGIKREDLHYEYHGMVDEKLIEVSVETALLFAELPYQHVLVTHASRDWARRVLRQLNIDAAFPDERLLALEDYNFVQKHQSRTPFEVALKCLDLPAENVMMVEDTLMNLFIPKEMGMMTAFIHHGQPPETIPAWVDLSQDNALTLLQYLKAQTTA